MAKKSKAEKADKPGKAEKAAKSPETGTPVAGSQPLVRDPKARQAGWDEIYRHILVEPGSEVRVEDFETDWAVTDDLRGLGEEVVKKRALALLEENRAELSLAQQLLYADDRYSVLIIFQAMDAAGKDGTIRHVMSGVNPQGCQVFAFKAPSAEELDHTFLWRSMKSLPERGRIGIFNRSYYEDVLVVRVHPKILDGQKLPPGKRDQRFWNARYDDINNFERHLVRNGTVVIKFFLNVSKDEQKRRFMKRLDDPNRHWKFSAADMVERSYWDDYMNAFGEMLSATSTKWAPWYVIPADQKWAMRALVAEVITETIKDLGLKFPEVTPEQMAKLDQARGILDAEGR